MKIATWNVNSIRSRLNLVTEWLQENPVEVLCLQETKVVDADFPRSPFKQLGYHLYISGQKSYNGVAIFSKSPLQDVSTGFSPVLGTPATEFDGQKRVLTGMWGDICIVNLYVPNGSSVGSDKYAYKLDWLAHLRDYLKSLLDKTANICICGDFNIALEDKDLHKIPKPKDIMASPAERDALRQVLELGFADAFRKFTDADGHYSWWDYRAGSFPRNKGWRIDHHYLTPPLYDRAIACTIDVAPRKLPKPSDHTPVILDLANDSVG